ncbi:MAG: hypothetical protein L6Q33_04635 [Bacteriovoracaceae bacterium]|nr:hypothetical protein [Bacteriovoracaceae bacterium]
MSLHTPILTTPVMRDLDSVFPGENWFFYWKTSTSLWKTKLQDFPGTKIIVPLNWSFHTETGEKIDFDEVKPETNLKRLVDIAREVGKDVVFYLPLTPAPFLVNGGLPHFLARSLAQNERGMAYGVVDAEESLSKIYSFFDTRVFQAFSRFCQELGQYFSREGIPSDLWGIRCGYLAEGKFHSFIEDTSKVYDQAFERFLSNKKEERKNLGHSEELNPVEEHQYKFEFSKTIQDLYCEKAREAIGPNFEGIFDVCFLGASQSDFFKRLTGTISLTDYSRELYESLSKDIIPSSVLINQRSKRGVLGRELNDLVANSYVPSRLKEGAIEDLGFTFYSPLTFFKVYEKVDGLSSLFMNWSDISLWKYLQGNFGWSYKVVSKETFKLHQDDHPYQEFIHFFHGHDVDRTLFQFILKTLMNAGRIVLNRAGLSEEYERRLETFFLENNLNVEKVNFHTLVQNITLGDGRLIIFDGEKLPREPETLTSFWDKMISTFSLYHIPVNAEGIDYFWRTRASRANELKFEEVRRLSLYNPTSYKKKVKLKFTKNFVVYKVLDEINASVQSMPQELDVELLPDGSVVIDFGVFS